MVRVTTGDQADTPITHILTGIADSGGMATGAIAKALSRAEPRNQRANFYRNFITLI